ncbi:MAG TPA: hypothetical protein VFB84_01875 [Micromonosporaceae bacterium]|nr:hypothetical protein [Micromonosporaceae bacterium]
MAPHRFVLIVDSTPTARQLVALAALGARPAAVPGPRQSGGWIVFERAELDLAGAVVAAVRDAEGAGLRPVRLVDGDWVTLADIADRLGRSREAVRLWALGRVGPGGFPPPVNPGRDTLFYSWAEVSPWLRDRLCVPAPGSDPVLAAAGLAVRMRALAPRVPDMATLRELIGP